jgi:hypothetical protein
MSTLTSILLLAACQGTVTTEEQPIEPSAWEWSAPEDLTPVYDEALVTGAIQALADQALSLTSQPIFDGFDAAMALADGTCPAWYEYEGEIFWRGICYTTDGSWFNGQAFFYAYDGVEFNGDGGTWYADQVSGTNTVQDPEGHAFNMGGYAFLGSGSYPDGTMQWLSTMGGSFSSTWPMAAETWMGQNVQPMVGVSATLTGGSGTRRLYIYGTVGGLGSPATGIEISQFSMDDGGGSCSVEPTAALSVRDDLGVWWDVHFRGEVDHTGCDGCGVVIQGGTEVGTACADFSHMLDWGSSPW